MEFAFDDRKLLLPGIHEMSLETVRDHFGKFQRSDRRVKLFARLTAYLDAVKKAISGASVILDGSFVMACVDEPEDIDIILVFPPDWDDAADLKPYQYNLVSKKAVERAFGFDLFTVQSGSAEEEKWTKFFTGVKIEWRQKFGWPDDAKKGLVRVRL